LQKLLKKLNSRLKLRIVTPEGVSGVSKRVVERIDIKLNEVERIESSDVIFLVDTNTTGQLGNWKRLVEDAEKPIIVIDHHARHPETSKIASMMFVNDKSTSTCEILFQLYKEFKIRIDRECAQALLIGMTYDSAHFTIATSMTFETAASLIGSGADLQDAISTLTNPMSDSERMARLKAAQRIDVRRMGKWIVAAAKISSHQASASRAFIGLGAHIAMVAGEKDGKVRVSMRSSKSFNKETGIHLGKDLAKPLGEALDGTGGGHESAAGVNGTGQPDKALSHFYELLSTRLKAT